MFPDSLNLFDTSLVASLVCSGGALMTSVWCRALNNPNQKQEKAYRLFLASPAFYTLVYGFDLVCLGLLYI